jgi:7-keto-8-aminopelargonate synthetase-like enzyme
MTRLQPLQQVDRTYVRYRNRTLSYFSGCDYFRLSSHPGVIKAMRGGLTKFGLNVAASRLTTGNHPLYETLEAQLAQFFGAEAAVLLPSGYLTGLAVAQAFAGNFSHALLDERAHPALLDAAQMLDCPLLRFRHRDPDDFARTVARCGRGTRPIVLTDGMFPHDGSTAPLKSYLKSLPADALIIVDDAHGAGMLGKTGKGTIEAEGIDRRRVVQCITLSKAFGVYGGAVIGSRMVRESIVARSRLFLGSTPAPLPIANAALAAIKILKGNKLRERLAANALYVKSALRKAGVDVAAGSGPIIPLGFENESENAALKRRLLAVEIFPPWLKYPGGPAKGYFRFVLSSEHSRAQLNGLIEVLARHSRGAGRR